MDLAVPGGERLADALAQLPVEEGVRRAGPPRRQRSPSMSRCEDRRSISARAVVAVLGAGDVERGLVERADDDMRERAHRLARDRALVHRGLEQRHRLAERVTLADLAPLLPAQHAGRVEQQDAVGRPGSSQTSSHAPTIAAGPRRRRRRLGDDLERRARAIISSSSAVTTARNRSFLSANWW